MENNNFSVETEEHSGHMERTILCLRREPEQKFAEKYYKTGSEPPPCFLYCIAFRR